MAEGDTPDYRWRKHNAGIGSITGQQKDPGRNQRSANCRRAYEQAHNRPLRHWRALTTREGAYTLLGKDTERILERYKATKVFLATSALDIKNGLSVLNAAEASIKQAMVAAAQEVICLVDYSKFHHVAFAPFCPMEKIGTLITDTRITADDAEILRQLGIQLHIA